MKIMGTGPNFYAALPLSMPGQGYQLYVPIQLLAILSFNMFLSPEEFIPYLKVDSGLIL